MILYKVNGALYDVNYEYDQDSPTLQSPEESSLFEESGVIPGLTRRRISIATSAFHQVGYYGPVVQATPATTANLNLDSSQVTLVADYGKLKPIL